MRHQGNKPRKSGIDEIFCTICYHILMGGEKFDVARPTKAEYIANSLEQKQMVKSIFVKICINIM